MIPSKIFGSEFLLAAAAAARALALGRRAERIKSNQHNNHTKSIRTMLSVARLTATRALTKTCPRAAAATVGSRNMVGFADSMKSKVRSLS